MDKWLDKASSIALVWLELNILLKQDAKTFPLSPVVIVGPAALAYEQQSHAESDAHCTLLWESRSANKQMSI